MFFTDPDTGQSYWLVVGGTSVPTPCWAAIIGLADQIRKLPLTDGHQQIYTLATGSAYANNYYDITMDCAGPGYDFVTGIGSPRADHLVQALGCPPGTAPNTGPGTATDTGP